MKEWRQRWVVEPTGGVLLGLPKPGRGSRARVARRPRPKTFPRGNVRPLRKTHLHPAEQLGPAPNSRLGPQQLQGL